MSGPTIGEMMGMGIEKMSRQYGNKIYLDRGEKPPEGKRVFTGPQGGQFYYADDNKPSAWQGPNKYEGVCAVCGRTVKAGSGEYRRNGSRWETRHKGGKCPGASSEPSNVSGKVRSLSEIQRVNVDELLSKHNRKMAEGKPQTLVSYGQPARYKVGDIYTDKNNGKRFIVSGASGTFYMGRDELEDNDLFHEKPGWRTYFELIPVEPTEEEKEQDAEAKRLLEEAQRTEEERVKAEVSAARKIIDEFKSITSNMKEVKSLEGTDFDIVSKKVLLDNTHSEPMGRYGEMYYELTLSDGRKAYMYSKTMYDWPPEERYWIP